MAKAKTRGRDAAARNGGRMKPYVMIALALPVAIVMLPTAIVLAAAMVPTMVAWVVDPRGRRYLAVTVGALNFAGSLFFLAILWTDVNDVAHAFGVLRNVYGWLIAYGAAALGYGVHFMMPSMTDGIVRFRAETRLGRLDKQMREMVEEWGEAIGDARQE